MRIIKVLIINSNQVNAKFFSINFHEKGYIQNEKNKIWLEKIIFQRKFVNSKTVSMLKKISTLPSFNSEYLYLWKDFFSILYE